MSKNENFVIGGLVRQPHRSIRTDGLIAQAIARHIKDGSIPSRTDRNKTVVHAEIVILNGRIGANISNFKKLLTGLIQDRHAGIGCPHEQPVQGVVVEQGLELGGRFGSIQLFSFDNFTGKIYPDELAIHRHPNQLGLAGQRVLRPGKGTFYSSQQINRKARAHYPVLFYEVHHPVFLGNDQRSASQLIKGYHRDLNILKIDGPVDFGWEGIYFIP